MENNLAVILIISHKPELSEYELISLRQCYKVLGKYPIKIICPDNLDLTFYKKNLPDPQFDRIDPQWLSNYIMFNKLKISLFLYRKYSNYKYILFYEPDAYVFRDDLEYWCKLSYDYIGAPWINLNIFHWYQSELYPRHLYTVHNLLGKGKTMCKVGNGGFSLRNVKACLFNIRLFEKVSLNWEANEDSFFSHYVKTFNPFFKIPSVKTALRFSFDIYPHLAFRLNSFHLPFGCHAWFKEEGQYKENLSFWKQYIV